MSFRKRRFPVFLVGVFGLLGPAASAPAQTIVITAKSVKELADDLGYLIKSVAPDDDPRTQAALGGLEQFKAGAIIKGLDQGRGFGLAVTLPKDFPAGSPTVVTAVPVSDLGQFLDSLKNLGVTVDDKPGVPGFSHSVTGPNGNPTFFVLESKGYALFSLAPEGVDKLKELDPASWRPKGRPEADLSVKVRLSEIPESLKDQALNQMEMAAGQQNDRKPGEKDSDYKGRIAIQNMVLDGFKSMIRDGDAVSLDFELDRKTSEISLNIDVSARPNTAMAKSLGTFQRQRSRFEGMCHDAPVAFWASFPMAKELRDMVSEAVEEAMKDGLKKAESKEEKKLFARFGELIKSTLNAPDFDIALAIQRSKKAGQGDPRLVLFSAMRLQDGREFERLVREAVTQVKPAEGVKVTFDVAKAADGTAIHQLTGPMKDQDAKLVKLFGKPSLYFAFREDAMLAGFGEDGLASLQRALDGPAAPAGAASVGPVALVARVSGLGDLADEKQEEFRKAAAQVFHGEDAKHDRISLSLKGEGDGIRLRLAIDVPALKLLAIAGQHMQK